MVSEDPLEFIRVCMVEGKLFWTYHINMRLKGRCITRKQIRESVDNFEIIEKYPDDKYLPSYLVYSRYHNKVFHILFALDFEGDNARVVTAHSPDPGEWEADLKTRRKEK